MNCNVVDIKAQWLVVEFEIGGQLQRKYIPKAVHYTSVRGPTNIPLTILNRGLDYGNVDLMGSIGNELTIQVRDLQDQLRRSGLWTREDYKKNPQIVRSVVQKMTADTAMIIRAAMRDDKEIP